jgi:hypothetical protein
MEIMAEFKKISDTEVVEAPTENDNLVLISEGVVKQVPVSAVGGGGGANRILIVSNYDNYYYSPDNCTLEDGSPLDTSVAEAFLAGVPVYVYSYETYHMCFAIREESDCYRLAFNQFSGHSSNGVPEFYKSYVWIPKE